GALILDTVEDIGKPRLHFSDGEAIARRLATMVEDGDFDVCTIVYNHFVSVMSQKMTVQQLIPFPVPADEGSADDLAEAGPQAIYEFEPDETEILDDLLPRNLAVQVYHALLESFASEQGARMAAMDSATRNAGDMIDRLTLNYNRTRQAYITREMIEIVSGAEAL
ncbi:MAG: F0F1 ATP synthase subunit gamma, partial [Alphaproteobacteria bacterium]